MTIINESGNCYQDWLKKELEQLVKIRKSIKKPIPTPRDSLDHQENQQKYLHIKFVIDKPVPAPCKTVKQMVEEYENNIIPPPMEVRDKPIPAPRTKKTIQRPVAAPRTKIEQRKKALKGFTKSFLVELKNKQDPLL